jgi:type IX secretion system PorP/SprF family membrane protein
MFSMLQINPSYAGNHTGDNITALYRDQWVGMAGAPKTMGISWEKRYSSSNEGFGCQIYNDQLGIEKTTGVQGFFSHHIAFEDSYLALGVSGGILNYQASYSQAHPDNTSDPDFQTNVNGWLPTAGFGVLYATPTWYIGFSIPALLHTQIDATNYLDQDNVGANNHYFLNGGYVYTLSDDVDLKPSFLIRAVKGSPIQGDINLNCWFENTFCIGLSYRTGDAVVGMLEFQLSQELRLGYSYDYNISNLSSYNAGTHELMLHWEIPDSTCPWCDRQKKIYD